MKIRYLQRFFDTFINSGLIIIFQYNFQPKISYPITGSSILAGTFFCGCMLSNPNEVTKHKRAN